MTEADSAPPGVLLTAMDIPCEKVAAKNVRARLQELLPPEFPCTERLLLLTSELVTNVVKHAGTAGRLELWRDQALLHLCVTDFSAKELRLPTEIPALDPMAESGRGLYIVNEFADAWEIEPFDGGKKVWLTLECQAVA